MDISLVLKNVAMTTGEGPHWDDRCQSLYHVDINCGDIHKWDSVTGDDTKVHIDGNVGFAIPRRSGGLVVGQNLSICHLDWDTQVTKVMAEDTESKAFRINDAKCDITGRLWAGSMQKTRRPLEEAGQRCAALYSLETDGRLVKRLDGVSLSNGLAWSLDNAIFYYIDSIPREIYAFDFDPQTGDISNRRVVRDGRDGSLGLPDGMTIDTEGKLWVACYGEGKLAHIDPETGKTILEVAIPNAKMVTSCCFGGKEMNELFVTSKRYGVYVIREYFTYTAVVGIMVGGIRAGGSRKLTTTHELLVDLPTPGEYHRNLIFSHGFWAFLTVFDRLQATLFVGCDNWNGNNTMAFGLDQESNCQGRISIAYS